MNYLNSFIFIFSFFLFFSIYTSFINCFYYLFFSLLLFSHHFAVGLISFLDDSSCRQGIVFKTDLISKRLISCLKNLIIHLYIYIIFDLCIFSHWNSCMPHQDIQRSSTSFQKSCVSISSLNIPHETRNSTLQQFVSLFTSLSNPFLSRFSIFYFSIQPITDIHDDRFVI